MMSLAEANMAGALDSGLADSYSEHDLPLTVFEKFMLLDGTGSHPMNFFIRFVWAGKVDRMAFERGLRAALQRQPLLRAHCVVSKGEYRWQIVNEPQLPLIWTEGEPSPQEFAAIRLQSEIGVRVRVADNGDQTQMLFEFHHACVDGLAAFRFIGEVLSAYDAAFHGLWPPTWQPVDYHRLRDRGYWPPPADAPPFGLRSCWIGFREVWRFLWRRPIPLAPRCRSESPNDALPRVNQMLNHRFSVADSNSIRSAAGKAQVTANDLLLCAIFLATDEWNTRCGDNRRRKYMRINMPSSVDERCRESMPACNQMSYAFLTRRRRACDDPLELLQSIRTETGLIKRWNLGSFFLNGLTFVNRIKGLLAGLLWFRRGCFATAVLSNVGDLSKRLFPDAQRKEEVTSGNLALRDVFGAPPLRNNTRLSMGVLTYQRRLSVTARFDPNGYSEAQTHQFMELFIEHIVQLVQTISTYPKP
jgi:NRPS condensation-like uncharacterized protein